MCICSIIAGTFLPSKYASASRFQVCKVNFASLALLSALSAISETLYTGVHPVHYSSGSTGELHNFVVSRCKLIACTTITVVFVPFAMLRISLRSFDTPDQLPRLFQHFRVPFFAPWSINYLLDFVHGMPAFCYPVVGPSCTYKVANKMCIVDIEVTCKLYCLDKIWPI